jgi:hypothetical protein
MYVPLETPGHPATGGDPATNYCRPSLLLL